MCYLTVFSNRWMQFLINTFHQQIPIENSHFQYCIDGLYIDDYEVAVAVQQYVKNALALYMPFVFQAATALEASVRSEDTNLYAALQTFTGALSQLEMLWVYITTLCYTTEMHSLLITYGLE